MDTEKAWAIGIIEGEGTFYAGVTHGSYKSRGYGPYERSIKSGYVRVSNTDLDVLQRLQAVLGGRINGPIKRDKSSLGKKPIYQWHLQKHDELVELLFAILPFMSERRTGQIIRTLRALRSVL